MKLRNPYSVPAVKTKHMTYSFSNISIKLLNLLIGHNPDLKMVDFKNLLRLDLTKLDLFNKARKAWITS